MTHGVELIPHELDYLTICSRKYKESAVLRDLTEGILILNVSMHGGVVSIDNTLGKAYRRLAKAFSSKSLARWIVYIATGKFPLDMAIFPELIKKLNGAKF